MKITLLFKSTQSVHVNRLNFVLGYANKSRTEKDEVMTRNEQEIIAFRRQIEAMPPQEELENDYNSLRRIVNDLRAQYRQHDIMMSDDSDDSLSDLQ